MAYRVVRGDPGFFGSLARGIGRVARGALPILSAVPGIGAVAGIANAVLPGGSGSDAKRGPGPRPEGGVTGFVHRLVPGGSTGFVRSRRMNAGNAKAARRAIRRIKAVRHMLMSIERELPKRTVHRGGSAGVITRAEAARALRR